MVIVPNRTSTSHGKSDSNRDEKNETINHTSRSRKIP